MHQSCLAVWKTYPSNLAEFLHKCEVHVKCPPPYLHYSLCNYGGSYFNLTALSQAWVGVISRPLTELSASATPPDCQYQVHHPRRILLLRQRDHAALSGDYDYVGGQAEFHFPIIKLSYVTRRLARTAISAATERFPETL